MKFPFSVRTPWAQAGKGAWRRLDYGLGRVGGHLEQKLGASVPTPTDPSFRLILDRTLGLRGHQFF